MADIGGSYLFQKFVSLLQNTKHMCLTCDTLAKSYPIPFETIFEQFENLYFEINKYMEANNDVFYRNQMISYPIYLLYHQRFMESYTQYQDGLKVF